jgi:hypothetical protein
MDLLSITFWKKGEPMIFIYAMCVVCGLAAWLVTHRLSRAWRLGLSLGVTLAIGLLTTASIGQLRDAPLPGAYTVNSADPKQQPSE